MAQDIKVIIEAILKDKAFKKGVKGIATDTEKSTKKAIKSFDKLEKKQTILGKTIKKLRSGYTLLAAAIGGTLVAGFVGAIRKAGQFQQTQITFTTLLKGNKVAADSLIDSLEQFANTTPFLTDKVLQAGQTLLAFGTNARDVEPTLRMLGDISAATGGDLKDLSVIFGQIQGAGRLMGQDLLQLINFGFNPLQEISERTGESMISLKDRMSKGAVSFKEVTNSFKAATSEGGKFFNLTTKQSKSFLGIWSTLISNISLLGRAFGQKLLPFVQPVVTLMLKLTSRLLGVSDSAEIARESLIKLAKQQQFDRLDSDLKSLLIKFKDLDAQVKAGTLSVNQQLGALGFFRKTIKNLDAEIKAKNQTEERTNELIFVRNELMAIQKIRTKENEKAAKSATAKFLDDMKAREKAIETNVLTEKEKAEQLKELDALLKETLKLNDEELLMFKIQKLEQYKGLFAQNSDEIKDINMAQHEFQRQLEEETTQKHREELNKRLLATEQLSSAIGALSGAVSEIIIGNLNREAGESSETNKKRIKAARALAVAEKTAAIFSIGLNTARAIMGFLANPSGIPGIVMSIAAGVQGVATAATVAAKPLPSFAVGTPFLNKDTTAMVHQGERILRADQNIKGVSNEDFSNAAIRGLSLGRETNNISNVSNVTENTDNRNITNNFNGINDINEIRNELIKAEGSEAFQ